MAMVAGMGAWAWEGVVVERWKELWGTAFANFYEKYHYGEIPVPGGGLPPPPAPPAPQTEEELKTWTPERMESAYGPVWEQWTQAQTRAIVEAEQLGEYTPAGAFPGTYTDWESAFEKVKAVMGGVPWYAWAGGAVLLLLALRRN